MHSPRWCRECEALIPAAVLTHWTDDNEQHPVHPPIEAPSPVETRVLVTKTWTKTPIGNGLWQWVTPGTYVFATDTDGRLVADVKIRLAEDLDGRPVEDDLIDALADALTQFYAIRSSRNARQAAAVVIRA